MADGEYDEAVEYLELVHHPASRDSTVQKALGLAYVWVGRTKDAQALLAGVPNIVEELNTWAGWHRQEGRLELARNAYQTSLLLRPDQTDVKRALVRMSTY